LKEIAWIGVDVFLGDLDLESHGKGVICKVLIAVLEPFLSCICPISISQCDELLRPHERCGLVDTPVKRVEKIKVLHLGYQIRLIWE
jgi:hypothetical protein